MAEPVETVPYDLGTLTTLLKPGVIEKELLKRSRTRALTRFTERLE
jgi:hypothetical protein